MWFRNRQNCIIPTPDISMIQVVFVTGSSAPTTIEQSGSTKRVRFSNVQKSRSMDSGSVRAVDGSGVGLVRHDCS